MASVALSLRPIQNEKAEDDELQSIVKRIHQQYSGFRHVTEQGLRETSTEASADANVMDTTETKDDVDAEIEKPEDQKGTIEFVAAKRTAMMRQLAGALNDTLMLLDFTSLLESRYLPSKGAQTLSEYMRKKVPNGSMAFDKWEMPQPKKLKVEEERRIAYGWRAESLSSAADSLLNAANRLKQDVQKETKYWEQVLTVKHEGWTVFRNPVARQQLGVQIASLEAGPLFKERGLVTFRSDKEGQIVLKHPSASEPKMIRVRISRHGKVIGTIRGSIQPGMDHSDIPLERQLLQARDSLFEEELFHEMRVESRGLLSRGVTFKDNIVAFSLAPQWIDDSDADTVMIDLVSQWLAPDVTQSVEADGLSQSLSLAFRLLLSNYHRQRLRIRTALPSPLSETKQAGPSSSIVRCLMEMLRHQYAVQQLNDTLTSVTTVLQSAGLACFFQPASTDIGGLFAAQMRPAPDNAQDPSVLKSAGANCLLELPSSCVQTEDSRQAKCYLEIGVNSQFAGSRNGKAYSIRPPASTADRISAQAHGKSRPLAVADYKAVLSQLLEYLTMDIMDNILALKHPDWSLKGSNLWLQAEEDQDSSQKLAAITVRMFYDKGIILEACRESVGDGQKVEAVRWDGSATDKQLLELVATWIQDESVRQGQ